MEKKILETPLADDFVGFRVQAEKKSKWMAEAKDTGTSLSQLIQQKMAATKPLPPIVANLLRQLTKGLQMDTDKVLNCILTDWFSRVAVESLLFGGMFTNPFVLDEMAPDDWEDLHSKLKQDYIKVFLDDRASLKEHLKFAEAERPDLLKIREEETQKFTN